MSREIKFRAIANIDSNWVFASNIHKVVLDDTGKELWVIHPKGDKLEYLGDGYVKYRPLVVDKETICQYTGLKDKNGVEIYEGDIIRIKLDLTDVGCGMMTYIKEVSMEFEKYIELYQLLTNGTTLEVIGNIHENEELLENGK